MAIIESPGGEFNTGNAPAIQDSATLLKNIGSSMQESVATIRQSVRIQDWKGSASQAYSWQSQLMLEASDTLAGAFQKMAIALNQLADASSTATIAAERLVKEYEHTLASASKGSVGAVDAIRSQLNQSYVSQLEVAVQPFIDAQHNAISVLNSLQPMCRQSLQGIVQGNGVSAIDLFVLSCTQNSNNVLDGHERSQLNRRFSSMSSAEKTAFLALIGKASSQEESAYLWKALAAGNSITTISTFASTIHGKSNNWLVANLTLFSGSVPFGAFIANTANNSGQLAQQWDDTCASTVEEAYKGYENPVFALWLHQGGPIDKQTFSISNAKQEDNKRLSQDQYHVLTSHGGVPVFYGQNNGYGTPSDQYLKSINQLSGSTGVKDHWVNVNPTSASSKAAAITAMVTSLKEGIPTPLMVGSSQGIQHAVMAVAVKGKEILLYDPGYGQTGWMKISQLQQNQMSVFSGQTGGNGGAGGWNDLYGVMVPNG